MSRSLSLLLLLLKLVAMTPSQRPPSCHEVRTAFQLQQVGRGRLVPEVPVEESDLEICQHKAPTCCTRKMEESYQAAVRREIAHNIQALNFEIKFMIVSHKSNFKEGFTHLIDLAVNHTLSLFDSTFWLLEQEAVDPVRELFTDISLYVLGEEIPVDAAVSRFFDALFPLVYKHLINPRMAPLPKEHLECLRLTRQDINPFGPYSQTMVTGLSKSLWASRMMNQALNMVEHVINGTEQTVMTRECTRALVKMQYCPHCQGLTLIRPCVGYCLNVMRGCLATLAELDAPWRDFISLLEHLARQLSGSYDLELSLLGIREVVKESIQYAEMHGSNISSVVEKVCGPLQESAKSSPDVIVQMNMEDKLPQVTKFPASGHLRSEFIKYMENSKAFYATLAERLCSGDLAVRDGSTCWDGEDVVESYANVVVSNEFKAQAKNPEVKVRGHNVLIANVINRLTHFIQTGSQKQIKPDKNRIREGSGGNEKLEDADPSGDCDDEDGCQGSGDSSTHTGTKLIPEVSRKGNATVLVLLPHPGSTKTSHKQKNLPDTGSRLTFSSTLPLAALLFICQYI
ncbi:glypican-5 isoform X2 [Xenopus laevis]|uniref:Glypican-5 isoform X2 n=1 Tax=Xenopus laevis TaxID=8355 RepID=A0A8J0VDH4_XENLA|nr:glypican-5 isoform X2 [Xenopus laevis]